MQILFDVVFIMSQNVGTLCTKGLVSSIYLSHMEFPHLHNLFGVIFKNWLVGEFLNLLNPIKVKMCQWELRPLVQLLCALAP